MKRAGWNNRGLRDRIHLANKAYSTHPDDAHLSIVLCITSMGAKWEYVTWTYNALNDEYIHGRYFNHAEEALKDFISRGVYSLEHTEEGAHFMGIVLRNHKETL